MDDNTDNYKAAFCRHCGRKLNTAYKFCDGCGNPIDGIPQQTAQVQPPPSPQSEPPPMQQVNQDQSVSLEKPEHMPSQPYLAQTPPPSPTPIQQQPPPQTAPLPPPPGAIPSLYALKCPACGFADLQALGEKGAMGKSVGKSIAFGAVGNIVSSSNAAKNFVTNPMEYKCKACRTKFVTFPLEAQPEELLPTPCTVNFHRLSNFVGAAIGFTVYLNGVKTGQVKNGKTLTFPTFIRYNTIYVTDMHGVSFKDMYRFEAMPGGMTDVRFNRKFK